MKNRLSVVRFLVSGIVGFGLLAYTLQFFEFDELVMVIRSVKFSEIFLALIPLVSAYAIRGRRWMIWERDLTYGDSLRLILIGFMGNNIFPARMGEFLRAHCTAEKTGKTLGRTAALGSITVERILDGVVLGAIGLLGLSLVSLPEYLSQPMLVISAGFVALLGALIAVIHYHQPFRRWLAKLHGIFPGHITLFGLKKLTYFLDGIVLLRTHGRLMKALFATGVIWSLELVFYYLIARAVTDAVRLEDCLIFLAAVNFASLFPFTIGGIGVIEGVATAYLVGLEVPRHEALAMVVIQHGLQFILTTGIGGIIYFQGRWYDIPLIKSEKGRMSSDRERDGETNLLTETKKRLDELAIDLHLEPKIKRETSLSIVIPVFNEQRRLPKTVLETIRWCRDHRSWYELIIVDDGSTDDTLEIARLFSVYDDNVKVLACPHMGKGAAVRMGMLNAAGTYVLFMDADLATPLSEIPKLLTKINDGYGVAIGSRVAQTEGESTVKAVFYRKFVGRIFAGMVNIFAIRGIGDTQCGFKMFRGDIVKDIFSRQKLVGYAFDVEILYLAEKLGISLAEVSVNWNHQPGSKVNVMIDGVKMLRDTFRIRFLHADLPRTRESIFVKHERIS